MDKVIFRHATEADVGRIIDLGLREADLIECRRMTGRPIHEALHHSWAVSLHRYAVVLNDDPVAFAGCYPLNLFEGVGSPWLITTNEAPRHWWRFLKFSRLILEIFKQDYNKLTNVVDAENKTSIKWLKWLGFNVSEEITVVRGFPFHRFEMEV